MPAVDQHKLGTASWIDIGTDVEAAKRFYGSLFGLEPRESDPPEQTGGYGFFTKGGKMVATAGGVLFASGFQGISNERWHFDIGDRQQVRESFTRVE